MLPENINATDTHKIRFHNTLSIAAADNRLTIMTGDLLFIATVDN